MKKKYAAKISIKAKNGIMNKFSQPYPSEKLCPCSTGETYSDCCELRGIKYSLTKDGKVVKEIPLTERTISVIRQSQEMFRQQFGRKMQAKDKVFFGMYLHREKDYWLAIKEAVLKSGAEPMLAYAYQKTGFMLSEQNEHLISEGDKILWNEACDEYEELINIGADPFVFFEFDNYAEYLLQEQVLKSLDSAIIHLGNILDKNSGKIKTCIKVRTALYFIARSFNILKMLSYLLRNRSSRDIMAFVRTIYECYLRCLYIRLQADGAEKLLAQTRVGIGKYQYKVKHDGSVNRKRIVDTETGEEFDAQFQFKELAKAGGDKTLALHNELFPYLSGVSHADLGDLDYYYSDKDGFFHEGHRENHSEICVVIASVATILLSELAQGGHFSKLSRRDTAYGAKEIAKEITSLPKVYKDLSFDYGLTNLDANLQNISVSKLIT